MAISTATVITVLILYSIFIGYSQQAELTVRPAGNSSITAIGRSIVFSCAVDNAQDGESYHIKWFSDKIGEIRNNSRRIYTVEEHWDSVPSRKLYITRIQRSDEGVYTCTAGINGDSSTYSSKNITLLIFKHVTFDYAPNVQSVNASTDALIECRVSGTPAVTVSWRFHGRRVVSGIGTRFEVNPERGLIIKNITALDQGVYTCRAEQEENGHIGEMRINVTVITCQVDEYKCANGRCEPQSRVCDGANDCGDESDEQNCRSISACGLNEFTCANERCKPQRWVCDGDNDCGDGSDEQNCPNTCETGSFQCDNKDCISQDFACDGRNDCDDESDERHCVCMVYELQCPTTGLCVSNGVRCDDNSDCPDGFDEENCDRSQICAIRRGPCYSTFDDHFLPLAGDTLQAFIDNIKAIPLMIHCRAGEIFVQCLADVDSNCTSDPSWRSMEYFGISLAHNYMCNEHLNELIDNIDCLISISTINDYWQCVHTAETPQRNCTEENHAQHIFEIINCVNQKFGVRINNGTDGCTQAAAELFNGVINRVYMDRNVHPCPGSHGQRHVLRF